MNTASSVLSVCHPPQEPSYLHVGMNNLLVAFGQRVFANPSLGAVHIVHMSPVHNAVD